MGTLRVVDGEQRRNVPLAASTLVGRGWPCHVVLTHPAAPLYWLEIRWYGGAWAWRTLAADARTRGVGAFVGTDWRALSGSGGRAPRVSLTEDCWVELVDAGAPGAFLTDADSRVPLDPTDLEPWLEVRREAVLPLDAEGNMSPALADGALFRAGDRVVRVHVPSREDDTLGGRVDIGARDLEVHVDLEAAVARFSQGHAEVEARGACVRLLAAYLEARGNDLPEGGWLSPAEALEAWRAHGGPADAHADRVGWERSKLRAQLSRAGATCVDALYEIRRDGDTVRARVRPT